LETKRLFRLIKVVRVALLWRGDAEKALGKGETIVDDEGQIEILRSGGTKGSPIKQVSRGMALKEARKVPSASCGADCNCGVSTAWRVSAGINGGRPGVPREGRPPLALVLMRAWPLAIHEARAQ